MNQVARIEPHRQSLITTMAAGYNMDPAIFSKTVRQTCMPGQVSDEDFAAFLMVAHAYDLNPVTREIFAFPKKGGGIQPIVSVDGWFKLMNSHPQADGVEYDDRMDTNGKLTAVTCTIYRKDRNRPTIVTEYMEECRRPTEPWQKWPARMLRHKAFIQCARTAFGFAGIIDQDEAERSPDVITANVVAPAPQIAAPRPAAAPEPEVEEAETFDTSAFLADLKTSLATGKTEDQIIEIWDGHDVEATLTGDDEALQQAFDMRAGFLAALNPVAGG